MKKVLTLLLVIVMLLSLTACITKPADISQTTPPPLPGADKNLEEGEFVDGFYRYHKQVTLHGITSYDTNRVDDAQKMWLYEWAKDKMNINFIVEGVPNESRGERTLLMFISGSMPEIIFNWPDIDLGRQNMYGDREKQLIPLNDYFTDRNIMPNLSAICNELPEVIDRGRTGTGNVYAFPRILQNPAYSATVSVPPLWYHKPTFDAIGYTSQPKSLDELLDALRKIKIANPDMVPFGGSSESGSIIGPLLQSYGFVMASPRWGYIAMKGGDYKTGELSFFKADPLYYEALKFMNRLFNEGLIERDYYTLDGTQVNAKLSDGHYAMISVNNLNNMADNDFQNWRVMEPLTTEFNGIKIASDALGAGGPCYYAYVTSDCKNPEAFMRFMDVGYDKEYGYLFFYGPKAGIDDTYSMNQGWRLADDGVTYEYLDVIDKTVAHHNDYLANIGPFYAAYGLFDRRTDGSELARLSKDDRSGLATLELYEKQAPYKFTAYDGGTYDTDTRVYLDDLGDLFDEYIETETAKFITGVRPLNDSEWNTYVEALRDMGMDEYMSIIQQAYNEQVAAK